MMPHVLREIRRLLGSLKRHRVSVCAVTSVNMGWPWQLPVSRLTSRVYMRHNYIDYDATNTPSRCESGRLARPRRASSASPSRPGPAVWVSRLFRFAGPREVKYEMLRQVDVEGAPVARTADVFSVCRPTFYQTQAAFKQRGSRAWCLGNAGRMAPTSSTTR